MNKNIDTDSDAVNAVNSNVDDPNRHNIGGSMNRPTRNEDPLSPRNLAHMTVEVGPAVDPEHLKGVEEQSEEERIFAIKINHVILELRDLLIRKNKKYGNSALDPIRVFSKASSTEQIKVRLDDKLSRLKTQDIDEDEDVLMDLLGYLVLLKVAGNS